MIGYVTVGTNDMERAAEFYDQLFAVIGAERLTETQTYIMLSIGLAPAKSTIPAMWHRSQP